MIVGASAPGAFGTEEEAGSAEDVGEGEDEPGVLGDDVGDDEVNFVEGAGFWPAP